MPGAGGEAAPLSVDPIGRCCGEGPYRMLGAVEEPLSGCRPEPGPEVTGGLEGRNVGNEWHRARTTWLPEDGLEPQLTLTASTPMMWVPFAVKLHACRAQDAGRGGVQWAWGLAAALPLRGASGSAAHHGLQQHLALHLPSGTRSCTSASHIDVSGGQV